MIAHLLARPAVADWLIRRAMRTPYTHIVGVDGSAYMFRYWLFNPYGAHWWGKLLPSIRLHRIMREDRDDHMHDHPWDFRTVVLRGWYKEVRPGVAHSFVRRAGDTATLRFGEYHRITQVPSGGVWTLFITYRKRGSWGFLVDGVKVQWREYLKGHSQ